jgi:hypothetical protein
VDPSHARAQILLVSETPGGLKAFVIKPEASPDNLLSAKKTLPDA